MVEWLRSELGGLLIAAFGYLLRALSEAPAVASGYTRESMRRVALRVLLAVVAGAVTMAMTPPELPAYARVALLVFVGAATPELIRLGLVRGMSKLERATRDKDDGK